MFADLREAVIASVRRRVAQGDRPIERAHTIETLEHVIMDLATPAPDSEKLREALTPSGATKAAYLGEFKFDVMFPSLDEDDDEPVPHPVTVPWDTIKEIMAAIASRAALGAYL